MLGLVLESGATALGLLAPWIPELELINHFRPFLLAGASMLLLMAASHGPPRLVQGAALLFATTLLLFLLPLAYGADSASDERDPLRVVTLNLWIENRDVEAIARFLESERADVVFLQEADRLSAALIERLRDIYPHAY